MSKRKTKLELTWIGKENRPKLEPRILLEDTEKSYHASKRVSENDCFDNKLIFGDNLLALKALEQEYAGKVKCIYIDPPYNTGSAWDHYEDGLEHSLWLTMMRNRLELLHKLLAEDGSIWVSLDDNEMAYLRVLMDEIFGRSNFIAKVIWQKVFSPKNSAKHFSVDHDYVMIFAKNSEAWRPNLMPRTEKQNRAYKNPDNDPRDVWMSDNLTARNPYNAGIYSVTCPSGRIVDGPPPGTYWRVSKKKLEELDADNRIWWGKDGNGTPRLKRFLAEVSQGRVPQTFWPYEEVGHTQDAKKESVALFGDDVFGTPKPEKLMERVISTASNPGDLVLDSFAGSGTTGAVAHKMGRKWIMVELGEHCHTHIIPRLQKVIAGKDQGGISKSAKWNGGGGFRYYKLAPSLILEDKWGRPIINPEYNAAMLAEAMCKHMGFIYAPSETEFWNQGYSTERDFIYATTQSLTLEQLRLISAELGAERTLMLCCRAYRKLPKDITNLTIKKIPQAVLDRCEWGRDDYSLDVKALLEQEPEMSDTDEVIDEVTGQTQGSLF